MFETHRSLPALGLGLRLALALALLLAPVGRGSAPAATEPPLALVEFDLRSPHGWPDGASFATDPKVRLDVSAATGNVRPADSEAVVGDYRYYPLLTGTGTPGYLLKIFLFPLVGSTANLQGHAHFFVTDTNRSAYTFIGHSDANGAQDVDSSLPWFQALGRLVLNPGALSTADRNLLLQRDSLLPQVLQTPAFRNTFFPFLLERLLDIQAGQPDLPLFGTDTGTADAFVFDSFYLANQDDLSPAQRENLARALDRTWPQLPLGARYAYLRLFPHGNRAALDLVSRRAVQFLDALDPSTINPGLPGGSERLNLFSGLLERLIPDYPEHLAIQPGPQFDCAQRLLSGWLQLPGVHLPDPKFLGFFARGDGVNFDASPLLPQLSSTLERYLTGFASTPETLLRLAGNASMTDYPQYLSPAAISLIDAAIPQGFAAWELGEEAKAIHLHSLPVSEASRAAIVAFLSGRNYADLNLGGWATFADVRPEEFNALPATTQSRILKALVTHVIRTFNQRDLSTDAWGGLYDEAFYQMVRLVRDNPAFTTYAPSVTLLLQKYVPRQADEADDEYRARLARCERLWLDQRIVLVDLRGQSRVASWYFDVLGNFSKTHPNWIHIAVLSTRDGPEAVPGVAQVNDERYATPELFTRELLHRAAHSVQLRHEPSRRLLDLIPSHWFYEAVWASTNEFVTTAAQASPAEFWAENVRTWYVDSGSALERALANYEAGYSAMLNLFLMIGRAAEPLDAPASDRLPLFTVDQQGLFSRVDIPASWKRGDPRDGDYEFTLGTRVYRLRYRDQRIVAAWRDGTLFGTPRIPPALQLQVRRPADGAVELTLTGDAGFGWEIQAGTDLVTWSTLAQLQFAESPVRVLDPESSPLPTRFYRAKLLSPAVAP